jgi:glutathione S-transferase
MPVDPHAPVRISAFKWVPPFAKGHVRDLRARWALEEAGIPYAVRKLDAAAERPADYFEEQPFGQVPSCRDDTVSLFESGPIVLHVGRRPAQCRIATARGRWSATSGSFPCRTRTSF